jgi:peptidoglycan/xylan/chitin deacetylase (PgdA/CDA1 family)
MFHSVGNAQSSWYRNWLSTDLNQFEVFCKYLKRKNYKTILLEEWYQLENTPQKNTNKEVVLTFDDGFLDNWVFVYPILKKYGLKGTVFINPEFVDCSTNVRKNIEDVWNKRCLQEDIQTLGYLNWTEIKTMDSDRILDVQSHSMSHNFYFYSDKVVDIFTGQQKYDWMPWISHPELKPDSLTNSQLDLITKGTPVFSNYRALGLRRYFPDDELVVKSIEYYHKYEDKKKTIEFVNSLLPKYPGKFESDEDMESRYRYELIESKRILEEKLDKRVQFLCWPGGGYNELAIKISKEAGYIASTIASREKTQDVDNSQSYKRIQRFGMGSFVTTSKRRRLVKSKKYLVENFLGRTGSFFYLNLSRARKLSYMIFDFFCIKDD